MWMGIRSSSGLFRAAMSATPAYERVNDGAEEDFRDDDTHVLAPRSRIGHSVLPVIRPPVYYEEGPFDVPSSDDEGEGLIEKQDHVLTDEGNVFNDTEPGNRLTLGGIKVCGWLFPLSRTQL
jgi:dipeptidyl aminopeptidase